MSTEISKLLNKEYIFDPRILTEEESKQLWTTESVNLANKGLAEGYKLKESPYNSRIKKSKLRRANLPFRYTDEELEIIKICMNDKIFFGNNFTQLKDAQYGWRQIKLRTYQEDILKQYDNNRFNILLLPRQSGKTTTTIIQIVHFLTFNFDKDVVVIAQSDAVVTEILDKIRYCFEALPFFLQPGFVKFTDEYIELDNGCRLKIGIASESTVQGFSLDLVFIDEFAYIAESQAEKFWINIYPAFSNNPHSRCIIASTPNGRNLFHTLWSGAISKTNTFVPYRLYWTDVPGRDEKFKEETIKNIGILGWEMGYECNFDVGVKTIFNTQTQKKLRALQLSSIEQKLWIDSKTPEIDDKWRPTIFEMALLSEDYKIKKYSDLTKFDYYLISIDISEGLEQDYSAIKLIKCSWNIEQKRIDFEVVAVFHDNTVSVEVLALKLINLIYALDSNRIRVVVETNTYGSELLLHIDNLRKYNPKYSLIDNNVFAKFKRKSLNDYERGIRWDSSNKAIAVKSYATMITNDTFQDTYPMSIEESMNFCRKRDNVFAANYGHDDLVMCNVTAISYIRSKDMFALQFFQMVETALRIKCNDEPEEVVKQREEDSKYMEQAVITSTGFKEVRMRDRIKRTQKRSKMLYLN